VRQIGVVETVLIFVSLESIWNEHASEIEKKKD
jgi:hypothetical protein